MLFGFVLFWFGFGTGLTTSSLPGDYAAELSPWPDCQIFLNVLKITCDCQSEHFSM